MVGGLQQPYFHGVFDGFEITSIIKVGHDYQSNIVAGSLDCWAHCLGFNTVTHVYAVHMSCHRTSIENYVTCHQSVINAHLFSTMGAAFPATSVVSARCI